MKDDFWTTTYIVARYSPPGNYYGRFKQEVGNDVLALKWNGKGKYRALFIRLQISVWIFGNFIRRMGQHFLEFPGKGRPWEVYQNVRKFLMWSFHSIVPNSRNFRKFWMVRFLEISRFSESFPRKISKIRFEILRILSWMESAHKYKQPSYFRFWTRFRRSIESGLRSFLPKLID